ncbi:MAG: T9SS type A sorting domain-containing protein [Candidatus Delongbacteria bacterium]|nr:T9SS type A sorting domain-containing protein [Candidatus Delongbacteria bacterium]
MSFTQNRLASLQTQLNQYQTAIGESNLKHEGFSLNQNYPNPFNAVTRIPFSLPESGAVRLAIYDITGRQVAQVTEVMLPAGNHELSFDAGSLTTGIYFYRLDTGDQSQVRKMILLK